MNSNTFQIVDIDFADTRMGVIRILIKMHAIHKKIMLARTRV